MATAIYQKTGDFGRFIARLLIAYGGDKIDLNSVPSLQASWKILSIDFRGLSTEAEGTTYEALADFLINIAGNPTSSDFDADGKRWATYNPVNQRCRIDVSEMSDCIKLTVH